MLKSLVPILAGISSLFFSTVANADTITIDIPGKLVTYRDDLTGVYLEYQAVFPRDNIKHVYKQLSSHDVDAMHLKPNWKSLSGVKYPGGHPDNPLGAGRIRFLSTREGFERNCSIHGGAERRHLGQSLSGCCIRLIDDEFLELFWNITYDTYVEIIF